MLRRVALLLPLLAVLAVPPGCATQRLDELEVRVVRLESDNARLLVENAKIREELAELIAEKAERDDRSERLSVRRSDFLERRSTLDEGDEVAPPEWDGKIEAVSDEEFVVDRALFGEVTSDLDSLARSMRLVPHRGADGEIDGYRMSGIRRESLPAAIGLQNGDVVHAVNHHPVTSVQDTLEAYTAVQSADEVVFDLTRRGSRTTVTLRLR